MNADADYINFVAGATTQEDENLSWLEEPAGVVIQFPACAKPAAREASAPRPVIRIETGDRAQIIELIQKTLAARGGLYKRSAFVVRPVSQAAPDPDTARVRRPAGSLSLIEVNQEWLAVEMGRAASWEKYDARAGEYKPADPSPQLARGVLAVADEWPLPRLRGIVRAPSLRRDGSLINEPGFDEESELLADFDPAAFPPIPRAPGRDDALAARAVLRDALREFPFVTPAAEAAAIAAVIGALIRQSLPSAPAIGITASTAGTGKTELATGLIGQIATGVVPSAFASPRSEEEMQKALLGLLVAGDPVIAIDNASRPIESDALCTVITEPSVKWRWLGGNGSVRAETNTTLIITGNGLEIVGDLTTRLLMIELDANCERPDARDFERPDFKGWVREHRGELVRAALTIPLAYLAAGCPATAARPSRFHQWDRLVRCPLIWLGCADPMDTQRPLRAHDPEREALAALLAALVEKFGEKQFTAGAAAREAQGQIAAAALAGTQVEEGSLAAAAIAVAGGPGGNISARRLGRYMTKRAKRIVDGLRLEEAGEDPAAHARMYKIVRVEAAGVAAELEEPDADAAADADFEKWQKEMEWSRAE